LIEVNCYSEGGSKILETKKSYDSVKNYSPETSFMWITDGKGWSNYKKTIRKIKSEHEHFYNLHQIGENFNRILVEKQEQTVTL
jgi:hypothetical protein